MLRKSDEHLASQQQYELEAQAKLETARRRRQEERERQEKLEVDISKLMRCVIPSHAVQTTASAKR
jgi:RNA polymerase-associated protein CTR9